MPAEKDKAARSLLLFASGVHHDKIRKREEEAVERAMDIVLRVYGDAFRELGRK